MGEKPHLVRRHNVRSASLGNRERAQRPSYTDEGDSQDDVDEPVRGEPPGRKHSRPTSHQRPKGQQYQKARSREGGVRDKEPVRAR